MSTFPAESRHVASSAAQPRLRRPDGSPIRAVVVDDDYELELIHAEDGSVVARIRIPYIESAAQEAA